QAEDGIRDRNVTGVQTCALPISWCGAKFTANSFILVPNTDAPTDLRVACASRRCPFRADRPLPILAVDEPIYRRLPCFVIATVDKFAQLPWVGDTGALFGRVERHDRNGFYGPMHPGAGKPLEGPRPASERPARRYVGVAAQGRSLKVILLRSYLALLAAAQKACDAAGGKRAEANPADPYMTLLGYFNSLRELGGSRRIVEDEVATRVAQYSKRRRREPDDNLFSDRAISYDVVELTSRVATNQVATAKRRLAMRFHEDERVDVALATNMISVGLDIVRLGLMVVLGQPKTSAEYIQATSRVGRDPERPGLVVTLLNIHKPRDRSHYERFPTYHATFYRAVEAMSVTPFAPRAVDRG